MSSNQSHDEMRLFVRDEVSGRYLFNAQALLALGIDPAKVLAQGFLVKLRSEDAPEIAA